MVDFKLVFRAIGEKFSPGKAESSAKINFSLKNEPLELGRRGRYRDQPLPYGSGELIDADSDTTMSGSRSHFLDALMLLVPACRAAGATSLSVHCDVAYDNQCNFELNRQFISHLAAIDVDLTFSCFADSRDQQDI
jgi:hypothetical protein